MTNKMKFCLILLLALAVFFSIGALTHTAKALDISLKF